jgi:hypothetical protein
MSYNWWQPDYHWNDVNRIVTPLSRISYDSKAVSLEDPIFPNMEPQFKIMKTRYGQRVAIPITTTPGEWMRLERQFVLYGPLRSGYELINDTYVPAILTPSEKMALPYISSNY